MNHNWLSNSDGQIVKYGWRLGEENHSIEIKTQSNQISIDDGSEEEFITEHYWGYTKVNSRSTFEYEVRHPKWNCYKVKEYIINVDFEANYGSNFKFMNSLKPNSVILAEGSEITVEETRSIAY